MGQLTGVTKILVVKKSLENEDSTKIHTCQGSQGNTYPQIELPFVLINLNPMVVIKLNCYKN